MSLKETYNKEQHKWDAFAQQTRSSITPFPEDASFAKTLAASPIMVGINEFLGDLHGKHVLELGCGLGAMSTLLAKTGAHVTSFDLSTASVQVARYRAWLNQQQVQFVVAAGEYLPFADHSFDIIFGKAILHHLEPNIGAPDLYRVLKPGGRAAFSEPMGMNPLLNLVRAGVWYPHKHERGADKPVSYQDIRTWSKRFSSMQIREVQLLSMFERLLGFGHRLTILRRIDNWLLSNFAMLRRYCRYVVILLQK
jgi:ubiquinone/menaquinone biosynthesis C-methylase UbiE